MVTAVVTKDRFARLRELRKRVKLQAEVDEKTTTTHTYIVVCGTPVREVVDCAEDVKTEFHIQRLFVKDYLWELRMAYWQKNKIHILEAKTYGE